MMVQPLAAYEASDSRSPIDRFIRFYSIRTLVALCALALIVATQRPDFLLQLDQSLFEMGKNLSPAQDIRNLNYATPAYSDSWWATPGHLLNAMLGNTAVKSLTPEWFVLGERVLLLGLALFLVLGLPRLSITSGFWLTGTALTVLVVVQLGLLAVKGQWWPLGICIQYLATGYLAMVFWLRPNQEISELEQSRHDLALRYAESLYQQGKLDESLAVLDYCYATHSALELCYNVAIQQEKKRLYDQAISTYQLIESRNAGFKDVRERIQNLTAASTPLAGNDTGMAMAKTMALAQTTVKPVLGRYEIQRELGRGAMGIVYLGKDPKIARMVAIKTLNYQQFSPHELDDLRERFFREAEAAGRLNHPNIVTVYDVGEETDLAYIAMDYVQGSALDRFCRADELLPVAKVYDLIAQVADALEYAHQRNVVHRDIKPSNLLYNQESGQVKVSDFGIARISDESKTRTGQVLGSPLYMSPEQLKGRAIKGTADLFSLAVTFYQLLTGVTPFTADNLPELTMQIINKKHRSVRDIRPELPASAVRIINKGLQKDPAKRFQNAAEMAAQLRKALQTELRQEVA